MRRFYMKRLLWLVQIACFKCFAAVEGSASLREVELHVPAVAPPVVQVGAPAMPLDPLDLYPIEEVGGPDFSRNLRTSMSVVAVARDSLEADGYGCGGACDYNYNGTALAFKVHLPEDNNKVLWYMIVRFLSIDGKSYGGAAVVESKVEAKVYCSPDTYRVIYGTKFACRTLAEERVAGKRPRAFFTLSNGLSEVNAQRFATRKIFEWPVDRRFPGNIGLVAPGRSFNHVTPQDIVNGISTLRIDNRTSTAEGGPKFPFYTLSGVGYYSDAINCCGFCTRGLSTFGLPINDSPVLGPYLRYAAADYAWYRLGRLAFAISGPKNLKPELFITSMRKLFLEDGRPAYGCHEGVRETLKSFFPDAYPRI
jgi:hypothetical protein